MERVLSSLYLVVTCLMFPCLCNEMKKNGLFAEKQSHSAQKHLAGGQTTQWNLAPQSRLLSSMVFVPCDRFSAEDPLKLKLTTDGAIV